MDRAFTGMFITITSFKLFFRFRLLRLHYVWYGKCYIRYVIDYYHDESAVTEDSTPKHLADAQSLKSIQVDVRPALDSFTSIADRLFLMPLQQMMGKTHYQPLPFFAPSKMVLAERRHALALQQQAHAIKFNCAVQQQKFMDCLTEAQKNEAGDDSVAFSACGALLIPFQLCAGRVVCPQQVKEFEELTGKSVTPSKSSGGWFSVGVNKPVSSSKVDVDKAAAILDEVRQQLEIFELDCNKRLSGKK